jgi:PKD repeat protein
VVQNVPPTVGTVAVAPSPSNEGQAVTASAPFTDPGVNDTHTCTVNYGDGSGPLPGTAAGGTCTGPSHVYADEGTGTYTVTVSVSDNDGGTGTNSGSHSVLNVAPTVATPSVVPSSSNEGDSVTASATFTDPGTLDTHTCTVNYGDGSGALAGTVVGNLCTGPAHTYADNGNFTVTVTVTDNDGGPGSNSTTHAVGNLNPVVGPVTTSPSSTPEGSPTTASAGFTDAGTADTHTCSINWGDGSPASVGTVTQGAGSGSCSGSHAYADEGTGSYTVTITITDDDGGSGNNSASHSVTNVPPVVAVPTTNSPTNEGVSASVTATFTDAGTADVHTCSVNWGDGSPVETGTVSEASGSGSCTDTHVYGDNGSFTVTVTINDGDGGVTSNSTTHVVNNVAPTVGTVTVSPEPSVEGGAVTASASFTDPGANDAPFTCTVNYGDGSGALAGTVAGNTCTGPSHVYVDEGTGSYTVTIAVTDKNGGTGTNSGSHAVSNANPVITAIVGPTDPIQIGGSATVTASFTDAGTADTHTCSINWGAGTSVGTVVESGGSGTCTGSKTYGATGVYQVTVTVTDNDGGSDTETYSEYIVIFDPNGGFVTGGGWINSPPGAYEADPTAVGKANFGFVSKYKKGAGAQLEGETEFQFKAGDLNFHSTSYEWMVISGAKARYRGVGTINGSGSYTFELTAWDGQASGGGGMDKFRIRIYGVYDNQLGAADGVDPTTLLGGGSIVIHKPK